LVHAPRWSFLATLLYVIRVLPLLLLAGVPLLRAGVATDLAREFQAVSLDPEECYRVTDLNLAKEDIKIYLASGFLVFTKPIDGFRQGAVFVASAEAGDAEILLLPPSRTERLSLATFTQSPNLDEHFNAAAFLFSDGTAADLLNKLDSSSAKKTPELGNIIAEQWNPLLRHLASTFVTSLVHDALSSNRNAGFFYMAISGNKLGSFDLLYDPVIPEQIYVGKLAFRNNRAYFDSWSSFPSRSGRNGAEPPEPQAALSDFRIESTIGEDLKMTSVTRARLTVKSNLEGPLRFSISPNMHVTEARIDGNPVEVFSRESLNSNVIAGAEENEFLLIPAGPLDPAKTHELEIQHEGGVIHKAGDGVYYVNSRGTWYPRLGAEFATYDLTFRYPRNLTLVAPGAVVEDRTEGELRITRRKTEAPIRFAGFNLGDFQSTSISENGYHIDVYANRHVEAALQPKTPPLSPDTGPPGMIRPRRRDPRELIPDVVPPVPLEPAGRFDQIVKDVVETLDFMTSEFGPPATRNLAITPIPATFGQGFPGLVYLSTLAYLSPALRPERLQASFPETFYSELLEPHEIAHQWWGNLVTPASYRDEWLIESLANYCALLLLEKNKGMKAVNDVLDDYRNRLLSKTENGRTWESAGPITWGKRLQSSLAPNAWEVVAYQKGTWIIHMLRRQLGDENFYKLLRDVANRYRLSPISTGQFRDLAQAYTSPESKDRSLRNFFENWVDGTGIPSVKLNYTWSAGKLNGTLVQTNAGDDFTALVPVEVQTAKQKRVYWLPTGSDPVPFHIPVAAAPARVTLLMNDCLLTISR
jgi:hypothetical protein